MNTLSSLKRQIEQLGAARSMRQCIAKIQNGGSKVYPDRPPGPMHNNWPPKFDRPNTLTAFRSKTSTSCLKNQTPSPVLLFVAVVSLTGTMGHRFYNQPKLDVGTKAPQTIQAPASASVPDYKTTEDQRKAARNGAVQILMLVPGVDAQVDRDLAEFLKQGSELRQVAGSLPLAGAGGLSNAAQLYLRNCPEWEWRSILAQVGDGGNSSGLSLQSPATPQQAANQSQQDAVAQLKAYSRSVPAADFKNLTDSISEARQRYLNALEALEKQSSASLGEIYDLSLFDLSDAEWQTTQTGMSRVAKRMMAQGIPQGLPKQVLQEAARLQASDEVPLTAQTFAVEGLTAILQPNLARDPEGTKQLAELAAQKVKPVTLEVQQGEIIVAAGQEIAPSDFVLLDYFGLSRRGVNWLGLAGFVCLIGGAIAIVLLVEKHYRFLRRRDRLLLLLLALSAPVLVSLGLPWTSLPAIGILAGSFYGSAVGVTAVGLLSALLPVGLDVDLIHLAASAAGGLLGAFMAKRLRSREELALLGVAVGLTQGMVYLLGTLIASAASGSIWYVFLGTVGAQGLAGLAWSVVALGISPYLEHVFDLITPTRLAELANPNRPLLKRLAAEAPGTFQHTLFVASLAEAAARELGCNVELVRTGTLYHDIGKMHDPIGFCENQMGGPNKHDEINDPWASAEIIKKHVTEGLVMARKHRLPKAIQAFIPEHQGTMSIAYFYHQALQLAAQESEDVKIVLADADRPKFKRECRQVREEDFRYDGPIPQSRETGIVMLADSCEAALRSLKDATHDEALSMVNKILRARWQDNQLLDSGLTREDMSVIAEVFVRVWEQFNHKRIAYPKAVFTV
ncbi:MAG: HDIG domain-containing protein [Richelia sp. CSU_2_1]|nr:HDIG domain-containing protein [Richelia sp. CSU_2_1]